MTSRYRVDSKRIYLVGYSMGGYAAWKTASAYPDLFAAIVPISGGGETTNAHSLVPISIWAFHGAADKIVPLEENERMVQSVRKSGGRAQLTIFPHEGHSICDHVLNEPDLWNWLFRQVQPSSHEAMTK